MNKSTRMILVTGLARSGTTLLSECLDHHPQMMCIADPMNEFFKGFMRYAYYKVENERKNVGYPIDNFFFSGSKRVSQFIDETDLNHPIPDYLKAEILARIALRDGEYCPEIIEPLKYCKATTFDGLYLEILQLLFDAYGEPGTLCYGIKTAWCEQLLKPLARTFPNMTFVNIIRDPRAVIASNYQDKGSRFPILFNIRDWRKSVYYDWKYQHSDPILENRFVGVAYEDILANPEMVLKKITDLVGLEYSEEMIWRGFKQPNSSYAVKSDTKGISSASKNKWMEILPKDIVLQTETYCGTEMEKLNYKKLFPDKAPDINSLTLMEDNTYEFLSEWCKELVQRKKYYENTWHIYNTYLETIRLVLLKDDINCNNLSMIDDFFYDHKYFLWLRNNRPSEIGYAG